MDVQKRVLMGFPIEILFGVGGLFFLLGILMFVFWGLFNGYIWLVTRKSENKHITQELPTVDGTLRPAPKR